MTAAVNGTRNGTRTRSPELPATSLPSESQEGEPQPAEAELVPEKDEEQSSSELTELQRRLRDAKTRVAIFRDLKTYENDPILTESRSNAAQRKHNKRLEAKERWSRWFGRVADFCEVVHTYGQRRTQRLHEKAQETFDYLNSADRKIVESYRKQKRTTQIVLPMLLVALLAMTKSVHDGIAGPDAGTWDMLWAYCIEPLASVGLMLNFMSQLNARQQGNPVGWGSIAMDVALAGTSLLLNTVPGYLQNPSWTSSDLIGHAALPVLVMFLVAIWHSCTSSYSTDIRNAKTNPLLQERLTLLRGAVASGDLAPDASANQVQKYLRANLPGGIGQRDARDVARSFLGY